MKIKNLWMILMVFGMLSVFACKHEPKKPEVKVTKSTREYYTCPMHTDVMRADSGNCNKCGMKLVKIVTKVRDSSQVEE